MAGSLKLTKYAVANVDYLYLGAYRMRIVASDAGGGADPYVFLHRRDPINPHTGNTLDTFFAICSPVDMAEYPIVEPDPRLRLPFFRDDHIEIDFRAVSDADEVWDLVQREVRVLLDAMDILNRLSIDEEVWIPDEPEDSASESTSESVIISV